MTNYQIGPLADKVGSWAETERTKWCIKNNCNFTRGLNTDLAKKVKEAKEKQTKN